MATATRTANDLARMFAERLGPHGGFISAKQAAWLRDLDRRESGRHYDPRQDVAGLLCEACHAGWRLQVQRNGAGYLRLGLCTHRPCNEAKCSCQTGNGYAGSDLNAR